MWGKYQVELRFTTPFASSTPKNPKDIEAMLVRGMELDIGSLSGRNTNGTWNHSPD